MSVADNVILLPDMSVRSRRVVAIDLEDFCRADHLGHWERRSNLSGIVLLHYPRALLVCTSDGNCLALYIEGTNINWIFEGAIDLDEEQEILSAQCG
jgi:hypothetical protein